MRMQRYANFPMLQIFFGKYWVMMHEIVGNYRLFWIRIGDIFSEKEIPFDKVLMMFQR